MSETPKAARQLLPIGLGLMLAAAITFFTLIVFEDIALAGEPAGNPAVVEAHK